MNTAHNKSTCPPTGVILAGGLSSRMGTDKAELKRNGITMLEHCQKLLEQAGIAQTLISRNNGEGIADIIERSGPLGGIYSVIKTLQAKAVLILPVDMPLLQAQDLAILIEAGQQQNRPVCFEDCYLPLYMPLNEAVVAYLHQQLYNEGDRSVKAFIKYFSGLQIEVGQSDSLINSRLINTNTPQQWQQTII